MALGAETKLDSGEGFYPLSAMRQGMLINSLHSGEKGPHFAPFIGECAGNLEQTYEVAL